MRNATDFLNSIVDAWEALPGGRQVRNRDVEQWLADDMSPAINAIRGFLHRPKPDGTMVPPASDLGGSNTVAVDRDVLRDIAQLLSGSMFTFISTEEQARSRGSELYALLANASEGK